MNNIKNIFILTLNTININANYKSSYKSSYRSFLFITILFVFNTTLLNNNKLFAKQLGLTAAFLEEGDVVFKQAFGLFYTDEISNKPTTFELSLWHSSLSIASETNSLINIFQSFELFSNPKFTAKIGFSAFFEYYRVKFKKSPKQEFSFTLGGLLGLDYKLFTAVNSNISLFYTAAILPSPFYSFLGIIGTKNMFGLRFTYNLK